MAHASRARAGTAFTLIEVLVVVAIIALLVAVLLPSLARAREQARAAVCLSHLKQQGTGLSAYSADNRAMLPWAGAYRYTLLEGVRSGTTSRGTRDEAAGGDGGTLHAGVVKCAPHCRGGF